MNKTIFKAYDIRGIYPSEIDEAAATKIGRAYARFIKPKTVVVGRDVRVSSPSLQQALIEGLTSQGVNVRDIGVISTDMLYYAVVALKADGGITVSASHNPREYNGMKMTREQAIPLSSDSGLLDIAELAEVDELGTNTATIGTVEAAEIEAGYLKHVLSFVNRSKLKALQVVVNGNFGMAGTIIKKLLKDTAVVLHPLNDKPDGTFPKGRPDPLIVENRQETIDLMIKTGADLGIAWDADADRCFFYDENGEFVDGYYMTAILAELMLAKHGPGKIIHDPRLTWAIIDTVKAHGGTPIVNKAGHTFIKERMRQEDALFGGEMSAHYYFKDNYYCDNGMIPALLILEHLSLTGKKLSDLAAPYREQYFISGEINSEVENGAAIIKTITAKYPDGEQNSIDGLSVEYPDWRFNVRMSNTEPLVRLNVESKEQSLMEAKREELLALIRA